MVNFNSSKAFSLIEVVIAVGIVGFLSASLTTTYLAVFKAVDYNQSVTTTRNKLSQAMALLIDEA